MSVLKTYWKHPCCAQNKTHQKCYSSRWRCMKDIGPISKPICLIQTFLCINFRKLLILNREIRASWQHSLQGIKPVKISRLCQLECIEYILCGCKCELFTAVGDTVPATGWKRSKEVEERNIHSIGKVPKKYKRDQFLTNNKSYIKTLIYIRKRFKCQTRH